MSKKKKNGTGTGKASECDLSGPFYHGTKAMNIEGLRRKGFREQFYDDAEIQKGEPYLYPSDGALDRGIYLSKDWRQAQYYGSYMLRVGLAPGTRLMNLDVPADQRVIDSLKREFGKEILQKPLHKVLPKNKRLTLEELTELFRYLHREYGRYSSTDNSRAYVRWVLKFNEKYVPLYRALRSQLIRYGMHGYGYPDGELGMVVFEGSRVILEKEEWCCPQAYSDLVFRQESMPAQIEDGRRIFLRYEELKQKEVGLEEERKAGLLRQKGVAHLREIRAQIAQIRNRYPESL